MALLLNKKIKISFLFPLQYPQVRLIQLADHCKDGETLAYKKKAIEIAVAEGKHLYDKKQVLKDRDQKKQMQRELNKF